MLFYDLPPCILFMNAQLSLITCVPDLSCRSLSHAKCSIHAINGCMLKSQTLLCPSKYLSLSSTHAFRPKLSSLLQILHLHSLCGVSERRLCAKPRTEVHELETKESLECVHQKFEHAMNLVKQRRLHSRAQKRQMSSEGSAPSCDNTGCSAVTTSTLLAPSKLGA